MQDNFNRGGGIWTLDISVGSPKSANWATRLLAFDARQIYKTDIYLPKQINSKAYSQKIDIENLPHSFEPGWGPSKYLFS